MGLDDSFVYWYDRSCVQDTVRLGTRHQQMEHDMPQAIDPWEAASNARKGGERKKTVRLAGNGPGKAHTLIKCHNWRGKAVYVYHLQKKALKRIDKPTAEEWETFS